MRLIELVLIMASAWLIAWVSAQLGQRVRARIPARIGAPLGWTASAAAALAAVLLVVELDSRSVSSAAVYGLTGAMLGFGGVALGVLKDKGSLKSRTRIE